MPRTYHSPASLAGAMLDNLLELSSLLRKGLWMIVILLLAALTACFIPLGGDGLTKAAVPFVLIACLAALVSLCCAIILEKRIASIRMICEEETRPQQFSTGTPPRQSAPCPPLTEQ